MFSHKRLETQPITQGCGLPLPSQQWSEEFIYSRISNDNDFVLWSLLKLYERQTGSERLCKKTFQRNGCGLDAIDAPILSAIAEAAIAEGGLSSEQLAVCRAPQRNGKSRIGKYQRQIRDLLSGEGDLGFSAEGDKRKPIASERSKNRGDNRVA